jgi:putative toxin-antitoxin system antitoxin component (TIGR02293 family)
MGYSSKSTSANKTLHSTTKRQGLGVVKYCIQGRRTPGSAHAFSIPKLLEALQIGLPVQELVKLQVTLDVPMEKLMPMLRISKGTWHRRKAQGKLDPAESDRVVRFARLMGRAIDVLDSESNARRWLTSPQFGLGGAVPLEYAETEVGAREVEDLLGRIDHGVYS